MGLSLINQGIEDLYDMVRFNQSRKGANRNFIKWSLKIGFINSRLSMSQCFNHNFRLKYWIEVKLTAFER
jgi:hypothetical protein